MITQYSKNGNNNRQQQQQQHNSNITPHKNSFNTILITLLTRNII